MTHEDILEKIEELDNEQEIQELLEDAWEDARAESLELDAARIHYLNQGDLDEVKKILNQDYDIEEGVEHK